MQEKLEYLLDKYHVHVRAELTGLSVRIDGQSYPLLPWRNERRFEELRNLVHDGTLENVSVIRTCRIERKGTDLSRLLYRELDLCEWLSGSRVAEIMTFQNVSAANAVVKLENEVVCTLEVAATLSKDALPIDKHEIISQRGIACDRVVDTQVPQQSIYVFTGTEAHPETYQDVDFELFGLGAEEAAVVRQAYLMAKDKAFAEYINDCAARLERLTAMSEQSAAGCCNVKVEG